MIMKWRAFTLIELLVVIGIITFLTAIVIPVMSMVRQYARATRCGSNVRQITISLINYDLKNESFPYSLFSGGFEAPPPGGYTGDFMYDNAGWRWFNYIIDYSKTDLINFSFLWCPSRKIKDKIFKYNMLVANYGVNQSVCKSWQKNKNDEFTGMPLSSTDISSPGQTLLIVDSGYASINWYHVTDFPPVTLGNSMEDCSYLPGLEMNEKRDLKDEQKDDAINGRHINKTVNIGFVDGHVSRKKAEDLFVEKAADGYKNRSPLWLPQRK